MTSKAMRSFGVPRDRRPCVKWNHLSILVYAFYHFWDLARSLQIKTLVKDELLSREVKPHESRFDRFDTFHALAAAGRGAVRRAVCASPALHSRAAACA